MSILKIIGRTVIDGVTQITLYEGFVLQKPPKHFPHLEMNT